MIIITSSKGVFQIMSGRAQSDRRRSKIMAGEFKHLSSARGITAPAVRQVADMLLLRGEIPSVNKLRVLLGGGSPNTLTPLLRDWFKHLSERVSLSNSNPAVFQRMSTPFLHLAEQLWLHAEDHALRRLNEQYRVAEEPGTLKQQKLVEQVSLLKLREAEKDKDMGFLRRQVEHAELEERAAKAALKKSHATIERQAASIEKLKKLLRRSSQAGGASKRSSRKQH